MSNTTVQVPIEHKLFKTKVSNGGLHSNSHLKEPFLVPQFKEPLAEWNVSNGTINDPIINIMDLSTDTERSDAF